MTKNLTNVHPKLDRSLDRLSKLDTQVMSGQRRTDAQIRLMTQMLGEVSRMARATAQGVEHIAEIQADVAVVANEARREAKEAREKIGELVAGSRRR